MRLARRLAMFAAESLITGVGQGIGAAIGEYVNRKINPQLDGDEPEKPAPRKTTRSKR